MDGKWDLISLRKYLAKIIGKSEHIGIVTGRLFSLYHDFKRGRLVAERLKHVRRLVKKYGLEGRPEGNVLLIVVDCLRYRNMSFTGYCRQTTPYMDNFPIKLRAYAPAPQTYSSVPSILSGLYPHNHGAIIGGLMKNMDSVKNYKSLKSNVLVIPEILTTLGYKVIFITSIYLAILPLRDNAVLWQDLGKVSASRVLKVALKEITKHVKSNNKIFAYIHLGDLHEPLRFQKEFRDFFGEVKPLPNIDRWDYRRPEEQRGKEFEEYRYNRVLFYDNTLRYVDSALEWFIGELEDRVKDRLLVVVTADHGEEFWEHTDVEAKYFHDPRGFYGVGHGHNLFNEVIEVPLLLMGEGIDRISSVAGTPVSLVDLCPTTLDWLGLGYDEGIFDGYSLLRGVPKDRYVLSEAVAYGYEKKSLIKGRCKLLHSGGDGVAWIYDLKNDPMERSPIDDRELVSNMLKELKRILVRNLLRRRSRVGK